MSEPRVSTIEDVRRTPEIFGPKTRNLVTLVDLQLPVPDFVALSTIAVQSLWGTDKNTQPSVASELVSPIPTLLRDSSFAVRSSALGEDTAASSQAGQFQTVFASTAELGAAVLAVLNDAAKKLDNHLERFSIIIQVAKNATWSGTAFTRDPSGGRELVIEYHRGVGEQVVGGQVVPERLTWYRNQPKPAAPVPNIAAALDACLKIEQCFSGPQDIEWCVADGQWWWLQARPITTLDNSQRLVATYLDATLPSHAFTFEKTEISEIAPRPTPLTWSLLQKIYGIGGPVQKVYARFGVRFEPLTFLRVIGNELFVDRSAEVQTLLPAYDFDHRRHRPSLRQWRGLRTTLRNIGRLGRLNGKQSELATGLEAALHTPDANTPTTAIRNFLAAYEIVFTINLCAEAAIQKLKRRLPAADLVAALTVFAGTPDVDTSTWRGNSLGLEDDSVFAAHQMSTTDTVNPDPEITSAQAWVRLRERGRWLTVKMVNALRVTAQRTATSAGIATHDALFVTLDELVSELPNVNTVQERRRAYDVWSKTTLPSCLSSEPPRRGKSFGVSSGAATGEGVTLDRLDDTPTQPVILLTHLLEPGLAPHLHRVAGIVATRGGMLSHLAIIARERHIPVVIVPDANLQTEFDGRRLTIDGTAGTVTLAGTT